MIIKKWNTGTSSWVAQSPKVTYTDIVADVTAGSPVSIFSGGKLKDEYIPSYLFGGMRFAGVIDPQNQGTMDTLSTLAADQLINSTSFIGSYFIVAQNATALTEGAEVSNYIGKWQSEEVDDGVDPTTTLDIEGGDWLVVQNVQLNTPTSGKTTVTFGVVNNTYANATSSNYGAVKLGSDTAQTVAANAVSATASRSYSIQANGSGQLVVNVPWTDTVYSLPLATATTRGGIELGNNNIQLQAAEAVTNTAGRTYALQLNSSDQAVVNVPWTDTTYTAGTGLSLSGGAFSHADTSTATNLSATSRTYVSALTFDTYGHVTAYSTATETVTAPNVFGTIAVSGQSNVVADATNDTLTLVAGSNVTITTNATTDTITISATDTNTTYSAGNGIALSGTEFSVSAGVGLTQEASGLKMTQPHISGTATPGATYQVADTIWFDLN
jgi:hypothetical protein